MPDLICLYGRRRIEKEIVRQTKNGSVCNLLDEDSSTKNAQNSRNKFTQVSVSIASTYHPI